MSGREDILGEDEASLAVHEADLGEHVRQAVLEVAVAVEEGGQSLSLHPVDALLLIQGLQYSSSSCSRRNSNSSRSSGSCSDSNNSRSSK